MEWSRPGRRQDTKDPTQTTTRTAELYAHRAHADEVTDQWQRNGHSKDAGETRFVAPFEGE